MTGTSGTNETSVLTVNGTEIEQLLEGVLQGLISSSDFPHPDATQATKSTRVRGEGPDVGALSIDLANSLFAELDALGVAPVELSIDGLVRSERGYVAWASVSVVNLQNSRSITAPAIEIVSQRNQKSDYQLILAIQCPVIPATATV